jgi:hypothetical protein
MIAALIIAIIGFLRKIFKFYVISVSLCVCQWAFFPWGSLSSGIMSSIWAMLFFSGTLILLISGEFMMKSGKIRENQAIH